MGNPIKKILIVEDSKSISSMLEFTLQSHLKFIILKAFSFSEASEIVALNPDIFISILDLNLPDAPDGEIVDFMLGKNIPSIIMTASYSKKIRENILSRNVVDFVIKENAQSFEHIIELIKRVYRNQYIKVLLVDDSRSFRKHCRSLLELQKYNVLEAENGNQALEMLEKNSNVRLVITDYNMPRMDGFSLVTEIRKKYDKNSLAIIGLSANEGTDVSAQFLKLGANDFLTKKFAAEELFVRVMQNIGVIELIEELREAAIRDYLTQLYNRRYFFEAAQNIFRAAKKRKTAISIAMIDIDFFKNINDTYGHDAGDQVIQKLSGLLQSIVSSDSKSHIVSRFGGEEFCILLVGVNEKLARNFFEGIRKEVESTQILHKKNDIGFTVSIGISERSDLSLNETIKAADQALYNAKDAGRNRVVCASEKQGT